jgi:hypothetical protein
MNLVIPKQPNAYCYDNSAKSSHSRAIKAVYRKLALKLPEFTIKTHFNPGGIAVWGETYAHIYFCGKPVAEAYDTSMGMLVRQWDGNHSGTNNYVQTLDQLADAVRSLSSRPFVRF